MSRFAPRSAGLSFWLAIGWLGLLVSVGLLAPWLPLPFAPGLPDLLQVATPPDWTSPGPRHWFGTDPQGLDVLAGLLYGARQVVLLSLPAAILATMLGALAGGVAGFWGNRELRLPLAGWLLALGGSWWALALPGRGGVGPFFLVLALAAWAASLQRFLPHWLARAAWPLPLDGLLRAGLTLLSAVPRLLLVVGLAAGPPLTTGQLLGLLVAVSWPEPARLVRMQMLRVRALPFVEAAQASGLPQGWVWLRHALPHACRPLRATAPLSLAGLIGLETTLAFLGVGRPPDVPSWGRLLGTLRQAPGAWWLVAGPGLALFLTLLALRRLARTPDEQLKSV